MFRSSVQKKLIILKIILITAFLSCSNPVDPPQPVKDNISVSVEIKSVSLRGGFVIENKVFVVGEQFIYIGHKQ
jgi:hypothetical protein